MIVCGASKAPTVPVPPETIVFGGPCRNVSSPNVADDECAFCQNIAENQFDVIARGSHSLVVLDKHPINRGHILVIPIRHALDLASMTTAEVAEVALFAQAADRAIRRVLDAAVATNLLMSNGPAADQGVPHAHLHVIPREPGDGYEFREDYARYPLEALTEFERESLVEEVGGLLHNADVEADRPCARGRSASTS